MCALPSSHMRALLFALICMLLCAFTCLLLCALICVLLFALTCLLSCYYVSFSQFHPPHCLEPLAGVMFFEFSGFHQAPGISKHMFGVRLLPKALWASAPGEEQVPRASVEQINPVSWKPNLFPVTRCLFQNQICLQLA